MRLSLSWLLLLLTTAGAQSGLRERVEAAPRLALQPQQLAIRLAAGEELGMVSGMAVDRASGLVWLIQRGTRAEPVLAVDGSGRVVHAFGKGLFRIPHTVRLDASGNVWTIDAGSSTVLKFSPEGKLLLRIELGLPEGCTGFCGATDVAFGPAGQVFVSDGYARARVVEYTAQGAFVRAWGSPGKGPGQFRLPHSLVVLGAMIYVADRENGRVERFDLTGKFLGEISGLGRTFALATDGGAALWASMEPLESEPGASGWLVKLDASTGAIVGHMPVDGERVLHGLAVDNAGQPMTDAGDAVVRFVRAR